MTHLACPRTLARLMAIASVTLGLVACGGALDTEEDTSSSAGSSACTGVDTSTDYVQTYLGTSYSSAMTRNSGNSQCTTMLQLVESYRQSAEANAAAGDCVAAATYMDYARQSAANLSVVCN